MSKGTSTGKGTGGAPGGGKGKGDASSGGKGNGRTEGGKGKGPVGPGRTLSVLIPGSNGAGRSDGPASSIRGRVLGRGGENLKYISEISGSRVVLEPSGTEPDAPLQLRIYGGDVAKAAELVKEMLDDLAQEERQGGGGGRGGGGGGKGRGRGGYWSQMAEQQAQVAKQAAEAAEAQKNEAARLRAEALRIREEANRLAREELAAGSGAFVSQQVTAAAKEAASQAAQASDARKFSNEKIAEEANRQALQSAEAFWAALEAERAAVSVSEAGKKRSEAVAALAAARAALVEAKTKELLAAKAATAHAQLAAGPPRAAAGTGAGRVGGLCALFSLGSCPFKGDAEHPCPRGLHEEPKVPKPEEAMMKISKAKMRLLQQRWADAGGCGELVGAWQLRNPRLELLVRATEADFAEKYGQGSDIVEGWHGTAEQNVLSIAVNGFDTHRRFGQVYGAGEYFAKDPNVSVSYAQGGAFMFLCRLLLGKDGEDHTWAAGPRYYVLKQKEGRVQALPLFLVQFRASSGPLARQLASLQVADVEEPGLLAARQRGGLMACEARRHAGLFAESTRHLWLGWLAPELACRDDDAVSEDVQAFLQGLAVEQVVPERNGARVGAFVLLKEPIGRAQFRDLQGRLYRGTVRISVDDEQPGNPSRADRSCPRLTGPSHFCRGWNLRGHHAWQWGCSYDHPKEARATHGASYMLEPLAPNTAKFDDIQTELLRSAPFVSSHGGCGRPRVVAVHKVNNPTLEALFEERRGFLHDKNGFAVEKELWHGTSCKAIPELLTHGLQPPSDTRPSDSCPISGGKGLCTTLCGSDCSHCKDAHCWDRCHMFGLGVYLADQAQKSHRYVREPKDGRVFSMIRVRACLGNPYLIEGNLLKPQSMHDLCWCSNPADMLETSAEPWCVSKGHDSYYVRGLAGSQRHGLGVYNSEYIIFQPYQILPLYVVDYVLQ